MASDAAAGIDPAWPITTEDDPQRVYCSNPICGGLDVHPHYHQRPATAAWLNGGTIVDAQPVPHPCRTPKPRHMRKNGYAHGTTWRCECGQLWKLTGYAEDEFWTRITEGAGGRTDD